MAAGIGIAEPAAAGPRSGCSAATGAVRLSSSDARYQELAARGFNGRFVAKPDAIHVVHNAEQASAVLEQALRDGGEIALRSGGHCFENLVDRPEVRTIIDLGSMTGVSYDERMRAFVVEAGATLRDVYRTLFYDFGVTLPAGVCPQVGAGGHVSGGGYGPLSRRDGSVVDHLYGVEVVVADRSGRTRVVTATREPDDPSRELWWAHTGGGGGNFGIVTKYFFRSPGAQGRDPRMLLPRPPSKLLTTYASWNWADLDEAKFVRLVRNFSLWYERNHNDPRYLALYSTLHLNTTAVGQILVDCRFDDDRPDAEALINRYIAAIGEGVGVAPAVEHSRGLYLQTTLGASFDTGGYDRTKSKGAYLRRAWSEDRIRTVHRYLTDPDFGGWGAVDLYSYGGAANRPPSSATALPQRDSVMKAWFSATWGDPAADEQHLDWIRRFYRDVFQDTGGVPVPNADHDGCYINYADTDMADPAWNTSGVPWHTLYYKQAYPRLQRAKARWDPANVFKHPLGVRPPA